MQWSYLVAKDEAVGWPFSEKSEDLRGGCTGVEGDEKSWKRWLNVFSAEKRFYPSIKCARIGLRCRYCYVDLGYIPSSSQTTSCERVQYRSEQKDSMRLSSVD